MPRKDALHGRPLLGGDEGVLARAPILDGQLVVALVGKPAAVPGEGALLVGGNEAICALPVLAGEVGELADQALRIKAADRLRVGVLVDRDCPSHSRTLS